MGAKRQRTHWRGVVGDGVAGSGGTKSELTSRDTPCGLPLGRVWTETRRGRCVAQQASLLPGPGPGYGMELGAFPDAGAKREHLAVDMLDWDEGWRWREGVSHRSSH